MKKDFGLKLESGIEINKHDVPFQMLSRSMHIEIFGNKKIYFEGNYKIIEYTKEIIKIRGKKKIVTFTGYELSICNVQKDSFLVTGNFLNISFE